MSSGLVLLVLGSALLHAVWNAIIKGGGDKFFETVMKATGGGICALPLIILLPPPAPESLPYIGASVAIHLCYYLLVARVYRRADLSYSYTLMRGSSPLLVALFSYFILRETLTGGEWAGVVLLSCGILVLAVDSMRRGCFDAGATAAALANAVVIMGYTVVDGNGVRLAGNAVSYTCWLFFLNSFPLLSIAVFRHGRVFFSYVAGRWPFGLLGGCCSVVAYGISIWAMARAPIALVASLRESSVVFGMIIGVLLLKERFGPVRLLSVVSVLGGAVCIKIFA